jgi:hypothetical protein
MADVEAVLHNDEYHISRAPIQLAAFMATVPVASVSTSTAAVAASPAFQVPSLKPIAMIPILGGVPSPNAPVPPVNVVLHCSTVKSPCVVTQSNLNMNWTHIAGFAFESTKFPHGALNDPTSYGNQLMLCVSVCSRRVELCI